jgi:hypothetical protein
MSCLVPASPAITPATVSLDSIRTLPAKYSKYRHLRGKCQQIYSESGLLRSRPVCTTAECSVMPQIFLCRAANEQNFRLGFKFRHFVFCCTVVAMFIYALLTTAINKIPLFSFMLRVCFQLCSVVRNKLSLLDE